MRMRIHIPGVRQFTKSLCVLGKEGWGGGLGVEVGWGVGGEG